MRFSRLLFGEPKNYRIATQKPIITLANFLSFPALPS